jgi:hypothetical protein
MPARYHYRPYYSRWYVHPWYRYHYSTWVVVSFTFAVHPWQVGWMPPSRVGWSWMPGYWSGPVWVPGYWSPVAAAPYYYGVGYVYVPGYWQQDLYIEGYYRPENRDDGDWAWIDGYYLEDGTYISGHWEPGGAAPDGYAWEAGFFDGETWVEGFWRPDFRAGFIWISSWYDADGIFHSGYWEPSEAIDGQIWIPGWFDGNTWVEGYWISEDEYASTDIDAWQPEEGWHDGWDPQTGELETVEETEEIERAPLAVPVFFEDETAQ